MRAVSRAVALAAIAFSFVAIEPATIAAEHLKVGHRHTNGAGERARAREPAGESEGRSSSDETRRASANNLPTPESVFGFAPGDDYKLATYDQVIDYLRRLANASKYIRLYDAGATSQGR